MKATRYVCRCKPDCSDVLEVDDTTDSARAVFTVEWPEYRVRRDQMVFVDREQVAALVAQLLAWLGDAD